MNICIIKPNRNVYSETFIENHIRYLSGNVIVLYGKVKPLRDASNRLIVSWWLYCLWRIRRLLPFYFVEIIDAKVNESLSRYILCHRINVVLAEFGPSGVAVMDACQSSHIPLVVHFHGADAYRNDILDRFYHDYQRMFQIARYFITVSKGMEERLAELGAPPEKVLYNVYGVDQNFFSHAENRSSTPLFLAVGRFHNWMAVAVY